MTTLSHHDGFHSWQKRNPSTCAKNPSTSIDASDVSRREGTLEGSRWWTRSAVSKKLRNAVWGWVWDLKHIDILCRFPTIEVTSSKLWLTFYGSRFFCLKGELKDLEGWICQVFRKTGNVSRFSDSKFDLNHLKLERLLNHVKNTICKELGECLLRFVHT